MSAAGEQLPAGGDAAAGVTHGVYDVLLLFVCLQLVSSFQQEATLKQQEAETSKTKLSNVRKMISKLLKSINEVSTYSQTRNVTHVMTSYYHTA